MQSEPAMKVDYECLQCQHRFALEATDLEVRTSLDAARTDVCPRCRRRVGTGPVRCRSCAAELDLAFPHWHVRCDLAAGSCARCGARYVSLCIC
jgi:hypothetical protein